MGWTPLHFAALAINIKTADLFIKLGADVNAMDKYGSTPLHVSVASLNNCPSDLELSAEDSIWRMRRRSLKNTTPTFDFIRWIVSLGCDIYAENFKGRTPPSLLSNVALRRDMMYHTRRSLLLFFKGVSIADDLKHIDALQRVAENYDMHRYIVELL